TKIPDVCYRDNQVNMSHTLTTYFFLGYLHTTTVTYNALITNTFVFTTVTFIVLYRTKNTLTEQTITLRFVGTIVDRLWLCNLTARPLQDRFRRSQADRNRCEVTFNFIIFFVRHTL